MISTLLVIISISCGAKKSSPQENVILEINPKLIFLNYSISKKENGEKNIQFINQIVTDGKLKSNGVIFVKNPKKGDLKCTQLDENSNELQNLFIENPLTKMIEFVNDSLSFEKKNVNLENNELSLRLQLHNKTKSILISEVIDSLKHTKALIKTELK
tara:strand:- start:1516 stop:1989 length:474 start_codon:yes stop_codon:yes gene_type:complete